MIRIICIGFFIFLLSAVTGQTQEQSSPRERALMERVSGEINGNLICSANVIALQDKIKELEAKVKAAEKPEDVK